MNPGAVFLLINDRERVLPLRAEVLLHPAAESDTVAFTLLSSRVLQSAGYPLPEHQDPQALTADLQSRGWRSTLTPRAGDFFLLPDGRTGFVAKTTLQGDRFLSLDLDLDPQTGRGVYRQVGEVALFLRCPG